MKCPYCDHPDTRVIDSRPTEEGHAIRRRRGCDSCGKRFTTYEKIEVPMFMVVKKDARREVFDRNKVLNGIVKACEKRPVPLVKIDALVGEIERALTAAPAAFGSVIFRPPLFGFFCPGRQSCARAARQSPR